MLCMVGLVSMVCMLSLVSMVLLIRTPRAVIKTRPGFFEEIRTTLGRSAGDALKGNMFSGATFLIIPRAPIVW